MPQKKPDLDASQGFDAFWHGSAAGRDLARREAELLDALGGRLFGRFGLQLGGAGNLSLRRFSGVGRQFLLGCDGCDGADLLVEPIRLPILTSSVSVFYLPHVLEFSQDPHGLLREVDRTLIPGGRVLISGFNPYGLFGLRGLVDRGYPWGGHFYSPGRLVDWLSLLGFEVETLSYLGYAPPLSGQLLYDRCALLQRLGQRWWPSLSAAYLVLAVKREVPMNLLRPNWKHKPGFVTQGGLAEPTTRSDHAG